MFVVTALTERLRAEQSKHIDESHMVHSRIWVPQQKRDPQEVKGGRMKIDPEKYYKPCDPELRPLAAAQTLANWRSLGCGPSFIRVRGTILYLGSDLLLFLDAGRVQTAESGTK